MKNMKRTVNIFLLLNILLIGCLQAQIGIGTTVPDIYVMLDITTPNNNKGLLIPRVNYFSRINPSNFGTNLFPPPSEGMMIFDTDLAKFYYYNYNNTTPEGWRELDWDWQRVDNGSSIGTNIKLGVSGNVGIGTTLPQNKLTVAGTVAIGDSAWGATAAPTNGLTVKGAAGFGTNSPTPGYQVEVVGDQKVSGSLRVVDTLYAGTLINSSMVPKGAILMWSGSIGSIPAGWALCDGGTHMGTDGFAVTVPYLKDRFIVSAGNNFQPLDSGGTAQVTLALGNMPAHNHGGVTSSAGDHNHVTFRNNTADNAGAGEVADTDVADGTSGNNIESGTNGDGTIESRTESAGAHTHNITSQGSGTPFNIMPPFYALAFIIKI